METSETADKYAKREEQPSPADVSGSTRTTPGSRFTRQVQQMAARLPGALNVTLMSSCGTRTEITKLTLPAPRGIRATKYPHCAANCIDSSIIHCHLNMSTGISEF